MPNRKPQPLTSGGIPKPAKVINLAPHTYLAIGNRDGDFGIKDVVSLMAAHAHVDTHDNGHVITFANGQRLELDHSNGKLTGARIRKPRMSKRGGRHD